MLLNQSKSKNKLIIFFESRNDYFNNYKLAQAAYENKAIDLTPDSYNNLDEFYRKDLEVIIAADYSKDGDDTEVDVIREELSIYEARVNPVVDFMSLMNKASKKIKKEDFLKRFYL